MPYGFRKTIPLRKIPSVTFCPIYKCDISIKMTSALVNWYAKVESKNYRGKIRSSATLATTTNTETQLVWNPDLRDES